MPSDLLQILVTALFGAGLGYLINQLPPLKPFRGRQFLISLLVVELILLGGIWTWLSAEAFKVSNFRGSVEKIFDILLGAFLVNFIQLILGLKQVNPSGLNPSFGTVVKGTQMIGKGNKAKVNRGNTLVEDTKIEGEDQEFLVTDDSNSQNSSQNNPPNP